MITAINDESVGDLDDMLGVLEKRAPGDTVTLSGSLWHANTDTTAKPEEHVKSDWTLAAKRGREGKPGATGRTGKDGADGRPGRDLTPRV